MWVFAGAAGPPPADPRRDQRRAAVAATLAAIFACLVAGGPDRARAADEKAGACAPLGLSREPLSAWREGGFPVDAGDEADRAARDLAQCLISPDPFLRDDIGYGGLAQLLRTGKVSENARRALIAELGRRLFEPDPSGVAAPFAALALSELARTDRIEPFLSAAERAALVDAAARYLAGVEDYRAFDDAVGWRHGVAHGADLVLQLALNDSVTGDQLRTLRDAVALQISPAFVAYVHGEPNRLARAVTYMARRDDLDAEDWTAWVEKVADPAPLATWGEAFQSEPALIRVHNVRSFALAAYAYSASMDGDRAAALADAALKAAAALM